MKKFIDFILVSLISMGALSLVCYHVYQKQVAWECSIQNPENSEFVVETAFSLGIEPYEVTQEQFSERYCDSIEKYQK